MKSPQQLNKQNSNQPQSSSKKFLSHFQSINTPVKIPPAFISQPNTKDKYNTAMQMYASSISIIDKIADSPVKQSQISHKQAQKNDIIQVPMVVNLNPRIKEKVININNFFNQNKNQEYAVYRNNEDGNLNGYIQNIINIDLSNTLVRQQQQEYRSRSKSKSGNKNKYKQQKQKQYREEQNQNRIRTIPSKTFTPPAKPPLNQKLQVQEAQVNTDPIITADKSPSKLKKMDLLLVQIMRQKKRKGFVPDYFRAIQMKLVQILQYILHDEPQYFGLNLVQKMKEVLKNLQSFKGKTIDGQSKVNMLRIFFQQFRNLKKQRQQQQQGRQNKSNSKSKKSESKKSIDGGTPLVSRSKKNFDTFSVGGTRSQGKQGPTKNVSTKSVKQQDQWIGSLDN